MNALLSISAQLEIISRVPPCVLTPLPTQQELNAIPCLRFVKDNPGCTAKQLTAAIKITNGMARHRLIFLRDEGYIYSAEDSHSGITLHWRVTNSGKQFLARTCKVEQ